MKRAIEKSNLVNTALDYPYTRPHQSFKMINGQFELASFDFDNLQRTPVIACGSNAAPAQLLRKFGGEHEPIFVTSAILKDFLCSYSAHFTSYGSIPATLSWHKGVETNCHITWLTNDQLNIMHATEAVGDNYQYSELSHLDLQCSLHGSIPTAKAYISMHGSLIIKGKPIEVNGVNHCDVPSGFTRMSQEELQTLLLEILNVKIPLDEFILENINNNSLRKERTLLLNSLSTAFDYKHENVLLATKQV